MSEEVQGRLRAAPHVWIGVAIWLVYVIVIYVVQLSTDIPYDALGDSASNLFLGAGLSLIAGAVLLAMTATLLGWWRPALFERAHSPRWPIVVPALMAFAMLLNLALTDWASYDGAFFAASLVLLLVGFTEEMATRGLLIVGLRSRFNELSVWFISTTLFALMHLINALSGQALGPTLQQVGMAFLGGTVLYILRRTTGTLLWPMLLHGLWDFSTFAVQHGTPGRLAPLGGIVNLIAGIVGLAVVAFVIRGAHERISAPQPATR
ncbi:CPBP family intramembrane glutamic endopeptidase [Brevibacterium oceani]|uniref:CPBP family intramembrane glutamic endopeptidase n=1 Tax=Brevibacterium oceani TaxID=358099 RepID=UPI002159D6A6|nr:CPBP family intramembrane glutamic endopeptidase [Brevibacterium oceani]